MKTPAVTSLRNFTRRPCRSVLCALLLWQACGTVLASDESTPDPVQPPAGPEQAADPAMKLGPGDTVSIQVFGRPELSTTTYVADDGTVQMPLAGRINVSGVAPVDAATRLAAALREGQYLVNPQVTVMLSQIRSQQVAVLGEVRSPSRFPVESRTTVFEVLAQAGGITEQGGDTIYLLRRGANGELQRIPIDFRGLSDPRRSIPSVVLKGGDAVFVPRAPQFYIYGEVQSPNMYRLEPGMTVMQAISRGGGITARGSDGRIELRRRGPDGQYRTLKAGLTDPVQADDVLRVKERIF